MSIAKRYEEAQKLINGNRKTLRGRRLYGLGVIVAVNIVSIYESQLDESLKTRPISIKEDKEWESAEKTMSNEEIKDFEQCIFEELNYLGYEGVIKNVEGYDKSIKLSVKDTTP